MGDPKCFCARADNSIRSRGGRSTLASSAPARTGGVGSYTSVIAAGSVDPRCDHGMFKRVEDREHTRFRHVKPDRVSLMIGRPFQQLFLQTWKTSPNRRVVDDTGFQGYYWTGQLPVRKRVSSGGRGGERAGEVFKCALVRSLQSGVGDVQWRELPLISPRMR